MGDWKPLNSSNIAAARYDDSTGDLDIKFSNGTIYRYPGVAPKVYADLTADDLESAGRYFSANIKGVYGFARVDEDGKPLEEPKQDNKDKEAQAAVDKQAKAEEAAARSADRADETA